MKRLLEQFINASSKKIINTYDMEMYVQSQLAAQYPGLHQFAREVEELVAEGILQPVISRKSYGTGTGLSSGYRIERRITRRRPVLLRQLQGLHPKISATYYEQNLEKLNRDWKWIKVIDAFLRQRQTEAQDAAVSVSQRSFWLFGDEHFLTRRKGQLLLQNLGLRYEDLGCLVPVEPFVHAWGSGGIQEHIRILIVERLEWFHMLRSQMWERREQAQQDLFQLLILGDGDRIERTLEYVFHMPELADKECLFFYFGDLHYERFAFLDHLQGRYPQLMIRPFAPLYEELLRQYAADAPFSRTVNRTPATDEAVERVLAAFPAETATRIRRLFKNNRFLPQVALSAEHVRRIWE